MEPVQPKTSPELLTVAEVAELLRVSLNSVGTWIRDCKLPAIRVGKEWRISRAELDDWMDSQRNDAEVPA